MKKLISIVLLAALLAGCQLANPEATMPEVTELTDRLAGILVTTDGETPIVDGEPLHYFSNEGKKFYAEYMEETWYDDEGESHIVREYEFPEGSGMYFMGYRVDTGTENVYWSHNISEGLEATRNAYISDDTKGDRVELECVLYVAQGFGKSIHVHPVFQEPDGDVYALATPGGALAVGMGLTHGGETEIDGEVVNQGSVKITIQEVRQPLRYTIVAMGSNNLTLAKAEYAAGKIPGELIPTPGTEYLILESHYADGTVERFVYSPDDGEDKMDTFRMLENGICIKGSTHIKWEGSE